MIVIVERGLDDVVLAVRNHRDMKEWMENEVYGRPLSAKEWESIIDCPGAWIRVTDLKMNIVKLFIYAISDVHVKLDILKRGS